MRFIDAILAMLLGTALVATLQAQAGRVFAPVGQVDMSIGLDPPVTLVTAGQRTVFNFRVENHSREVARNVTATVQLPQGYRFELMFYNSFWETCSHVNSGWPTMTIVCTRKYFEAGRYAYISIPAYAPDAGWPLPLLSWGSVGSDTPDYDAANNWFNQLTKIAGQP